MAERRRHYSCFSRREAPAAGRSPARLSRRVDYARLSIWAQLHRLPEYITWMKTSQCREVEHVSPVFFHFDKGPVDIPAGRLTVSQLLDQVAVKSGDGFWAILQSDASEPVCKVALIDWSYPGP